MTREEIFPRLVDRGWTTEVPWLASKFYDDVCGGQNASIFCHDGHLTAQYVSEGNNVLSASILCPKDTEEIDGFLQEIERKVDDSYARRLLLRFGR